jgi:hypothetical protein
MQRCSPEVLVPWAVTQVLVAAEVVALGALVDCLSDAGAFGYATFSVRSVPGFAMLAATLTWNTSLVGAAGVAVAEGRRGFPIR